ncbi:MAG: hypothetical protein D6748_16215, partial [Calditrichaeota bacterium]
MKRMKGIEMMKNTSLFLLILLFSFFLYSQNNTSKSLKFKPSPTIEWTKKRNEAIREVISMISDKVDSVFTFSNQAGLVCVTRNDTLIYIRIVKGKEVTKTEFNYEIVKLKTKNPIELNMEEIQQLYKTYVELTSQELLKGKWRFYEKKITPMKFKNYEFVMIEEYLKEDIG